MSIKTLSKLRTLLINQRNNTDQIIELIDNMVSQELDGVSGKEEVKLYPKQFEPHLNKQNQILQAIRGMNQPVTVAEIGIEMRDQYGIYDYGSLYAQIANLTRNGKLKSSKNPLGRLLYEIIEPSNNMV